MSLCRFTGLTPCARGGARAGFWAGGCACASRTRLNAASRSESNRATTRRRSESLTACPWEGVKISRPPHKRASRGERSERHIHRNGNEKSIAWAARHRRCIALRCQHNERMSAGGSKRSVGVRGQAYEACEGVPQLAVCEAAVAIAIEGVEAVAHRCCELRGARAARFCRARLSDLMPYLSFYSKERRSLFSVCIPALVV